MVIGLKGLISPGDLNKTKPCAIVRSSYSPSSRNFELKALDGTSIPHLALTGMLMAGLGGIVELKKLTMKDCSGGS
jgi:glutamine synthetase